MPLDGGANGGGLGGVSYKAIKETRLAFWWNFNLPYCSVIKMLCLSAVALFGDNDFVNDCDLRCTSSRNLIESSLRVALGRRSGFGLRLCR